MEVKKINWEDKVALEQLTDIEEVNKVTDENMNEIKTAVNSNADILQNLNSIIDQKQDKMQIGDGLILLSDVLAIRQELLDKWNGYQNLITTNATNITDNSNSITSNTNEINTLQNNISEVNNLIQQIIDSLQQFPIFEIVGDWVAGTTYRKNQAVYHNKGLWNSKINNNTKEPSKANADAWFLISNFNIPLGDYLTKVEAQTLLNRKQDLLNGTNGVVINQDTKQVSIETQLLDKWNNYQTEITTLNANITNNTNAINTNTTNITNNTNSINTINTTLNNVAKKNEANIFSADQEITGNLKINRNAYAITLQSGGDKFIEWKNGNTREAYLGRPSSTNNNYEFKVETARANLYLSTNNAEIVSNSKITIPDTTTINNNGDLVHKKYVDEAIRNSQGGATGPEFDALKTKVETNSTNIVNLENTKASKQDFEAFKRQQEQTNQSHLDDINHLTGEVAQHTDILVNVAKKNEPNTFSAVNTFNEVVNVLNDKKIQLGWAENDIKLIMEAVSGTGNARVRANRGDLILDAQANISLNRKKLINVNTPTAGTDAANKSYVDTKNQEQTTLINQNTTKINQLIQQLRDSNIINYVGNYQAGTTYKLGQVVSFNDNLYLCKVQTTTNEPTNKTDWDLLSAPEMDLSNYFTKAQIEQKETALNNKITANTTSINNVNSSIETINQALDSKVGIEALNNTAKVNTSNTFTTDQVINGNVEINRNGAGLTLQSGGDKFIEWKNGNIRESYIGRGSASSRDFDINISGGNLNLKTGAGNKVLANTDIETTPGNSFKALKMILGYGGTPIIRPDEGTNKPLRFSDGNVRFGTIDLQNQTKLVNVPNIRSITISNISQNMSKTHNLPANSIVLSIYNSASGKPNINYTIKDNGQLTITNNNDGLLSSYVVKYWEM